MNQYHITDEDLTYKIINELKSYQEIASEYGCSIPTIQYYVEKYKIKNKRQIDTEMRLTNRTLRWLREKKLKIVGTYQGSSELTTFECEKGHQWKAPPLNVRTAKIPCPICAKYNYFIESLKNHKNASRKLEDFKQFCDENGLEFKNPYKLNAETGKGFFKKKIEEPAKKILQKASFENKIINTHKNIIWEEILKIEKKLYEMGTYRLPQNICTAASYHILKQLKERTLTQKQISELFGITSVTLRSTYKLIYQ